MTKVMGLYFFLLSSATSVLGRVLGTVKRVRSSLAGALSAAEPTQGIVVGDSNDRSRWCVCESDLVSGSFLACDNYNCI